MNSPSTIRPLPCWHPNYSGSFVLFTPVDTVREIYARFARRDLLGVFELMTPDFEIFQTTDLPWGGRFAGREGAQRFFTRRFEHSDGTTEPLHYVPAGNDVAAIGRLRGKARATGKAFDVDIVHIWTVHKGLVSRCAIFEDTPAMREALSA